mgnify:FL=1
MVKLVIDSNMLREEELRRFLANPTNYAVLTKSA